MQGIVARNSVFEPLRRGSFPRGDLWRCLLSGPAVCQTSGRGRAPWYAASVRRPSYLSCVLLCTFRLGAEECVGSAREAAELEEQLMKRPLGQRLRLRVMSVYGCLARFEQSEQSASRYVDHLLFLIENFPASGAHEYELLFSRTEADWLSRSPDRDRIRSGWKQAVASHPDNVEVLLHAANGVPWDHDLAVAWLRRAQQLSPKSERISTRLGELLAQAFLGIENWAGDKYRAGPERTWARNMVERSTDAGLLVVASESLRHAAGRVEKPARWVRDYEAIADSWLAKARAIDPRRTAAMAARHTLPGEPGVREALPEFYKRLKQFRLPSFSEFPAPTGRKLPSPPPEPEVRSLYRADEAIVFESGKPPDFAQHYRVVTWSCGTSCWCALLLDVETGKTIDSPFGCSSHEWVWDEPESTDFTPLRYQTDSRLLVLTGCPGRVNCGVHAYEWTGREFRLVREILVLPSRSPSVLK